MAATTATVMGAAGIASTAAGSGMSFYQMTQQRKLQVQAQEAAKKSISEARKRLEVNYMDALSIVKEPYELERDALLSSGAQSMEAARESQRGVAGTAGRLQMAQNAQQGQVRTAMGRDLMGLEQKSLTEEARLRDENVILDLAETSGAQLAVANAWEMQQAAMQNAFKGVSSMAGQFNKLAPENYGDANLDTGDANAPSAGSKNAPQANVPQVGGQYNIGLAETGNVDLSEIPLTSDVAPSLNGKQIKPGYKGMSYRDILRKMIQEGQALPDDINVESLFPLIYE